MDKEKIKQQRAKLKENALKVLHVICYILSGLFLLTLLISGLQSCRGKKGATSVSAETIDEYTYVYKAPQFVQSTDYQFMANSREQYYAWLTETLGGRTLPQDSNKYDYYACAEDTYIEFTDTDGNKYGANNIRFHYAIHDDGAGNTGWLLDYVDLCIKVNTPANTSAYTNVYVWCATNSNTGLVVFSRGTFTMPVKVELPYVFDYTEVRKQSLAFEFNKAFNYNAPLGITIEQVYSTPSAGNNNLDNWTTLTSKTENGITIITSGYYEYDLGGFYSNGIYYEKIRAYYAITLDYCEGVNTNGVRVPTPVKENALIYYNLRYVIGNTEVIVNKHDRDVMTGVSNTQFWYYKNSSTWINDAFRYIKLVTPLNDDIRVKLYAFNNNNQYSYGLPAGEDVGNNVFTLIATSFSGILPILSVAILPGITIGMLIFVPLVVTIIWAIISIIKK